MNFLLKYLPNFSLIHLYFSQFVRALCSMITVIINNFKALSCIYKYISQSLDFSIDYNFAHHGCFLSLLFQFLFKLYYSLPCVRLCKIERISILRSFIYRDHRYVGRAQVPLQSLDQTRPVILADTRIGGKHENLAFDKRQEQLPPGFNPSIPSFTVFVFSGSFCKQLKFLKIFLYNQFHSLMNQKHIFQSYKSRQSLISNT